MSNNNRPIKNKNESIKYKQENNNAIPFFNQGMKLFDNIKQKITQEFSRGKREGYENGGILGPNTGMQNKISGDKLITDSQVNAIGNNLAQYSTGRDNLTAKTTEYLDTPGLSERNYNLFINELPNPDAREITKCVSKNTLTGLSDTGFLAAYPASSNNNNPSNFQDFSKAKEACKTWAVDSNEPIFALTRDANSIYNCHVGSNNQSAAPIYTKPDLAYNLAGAGSTDANTGGLFANGLIGVYKNLIFDKKIDTKIDVVMTITSKRWADSGGNVLVKWLYEDGVYSPFEVLVVGVRKGSTITKTFTPPNRDNLPITGAYLKMSNNDGIDIGSISFNGVVFDNVGWLDLDNRDTKSRFREFFFGGVVGKIKNSRNAGNPPVNIYRLRGGGWPWGNGTGWGKGMPSNINPYWIWANSNWRNNSGFSEYLYYFYTNPQQEMNGTLFVCADDRADIQLNGGQTITVEKTSATIPLTNLKIKTGLNIFRFHPWNNSGPAGLLVALTPANSTTPLFISDMNDSNWAVSPKAYSYDELKPPETTTSTTSNTENIKYFEGYNHNTNDALSKYIKCDKFIGGDINTQSITASFGRNCSNIQVKPLTARYVKVKMMNNRYLQMSQLAIWGYEKGKLTNLAYKCRTTQPGDIRVKSFWRTHRHTGDRGWSKHAHLNHLVDYQLKPKPYYHGYHSGQPRHGEGLNHDFVLFDLGASYPITKIVYYNRGDCCQFRAKGMQINLYTIKPPISGVNQTNDGGLLSPPIILTGAAVQEFNVKSNNTGGGGGETYVDCSSHTEITPSMPSVCRNKLLEDANTYKVVSSNDGSVNCNTYCRGTGGNSWNNEMPNWKGAKCVAGGTHHNKPCTYRQGSLTKCICKREDSLGWAQ